MYAHNKHYQNEFTMPTADEQLYDAAQPLQIGRTRITSRRRPVGFRCETKDLLFEDCRAYYHSLDNLK